MATALLHNRILRLGGGFPEYSYTGASAVIDTGADSGTWMIALTSTGILTVKKKISKATIQAQGGGGGGGASNGSTAGSDGADGSIESLIRSLEEGEYSVTIGAAGSRGYDSSGYSGGKTTLGSLITANGGAGGARAGGNRNKTHTSIYGNYGKGGLGGTVWQYSGDVTSKWVFTASRQCYMYNEPSSINGWNEGTLSAGQTVYLASSTTYPSTDGSGGSWYKTESGLYVQTSNGSASYKTISDTRSWYGVAGNAGVILLSGKA